MITAVEQIKYNRSTYCVLPVLNLIRTELLYKKGLLNCYLECPLLDGYKNHIFITYDKEKVKVFPSFLNKIETHELYVDRCEFSDYHVLIFNIPVQYERDIELYKEGKYSQFSNEFKALIHKCHFLNPRKPLFQIIWKKRTYKAWLEDRIGESLTNTAELWDIPNEKDLILKC